MNLNVMTKSGSWIQTSVNESLMRRRGLDIGFIYTIYSAISVRESEWIGIENNWKTKRFDLLDLGGIDGIQGFGKLTEKWSWAWRRGRQPLVWDWEQCFERSASLLLVRHSKNSHNWMRIVVTQRTVWGYLTDDKFVVNFTGEAMYIINYFKT